MKRKLLQGGVLAAVVLAAAAVWAGKNADVWEKDAKATKVEALGGKAVFDLTAADIEKLNAVIEVSDGSTPMGTIKLKFFPQVAPNHCKNFIMLAEKGFYNGVIFHRVIKDFMIQGGDPQGTGTGGPGWTIDAEFSDRPHNKGTLSMARTNDPNSAGSQFFICLAKTPFLDSKYSVFGEVVEGQDVVDKIGVSATDSNDRPIVKKVMTKVTIVNTEAKPPAEEKPMEGSTAEPPKDEPAEQPKDEPAEAPGDTVE